MKNTIKLIIFLLFCDFTLLSAEKLPTVDYKSIAAEITKGCSKKNDQARAIYRYLIQNIAYDTDYKIRDADECWKQKKGVCQAFADLFIKLCEPLNIKCILVTGFAKTYDHIPGTPFERHAYVLVEGDKTNRYFFVDATWGSGTVNNGTVARSDDDMSWFHTSPVWMAFSHFPYEEKYQMLKKPLSFEEFQKLPGLVPDMEYMGFDGEKLLEGLRNGTILSLPKIYPRQKLPFRVVQIPMTRTLKLGETYEFTIQLPEPTKLALTQNNEFPFNKVVQGTRKLVFTPFLPGEVSISIAPPNRKTYSTVLSYSVPEPSKEEYEQLIKKNPYYSPLIQDIDGYSSNIPLLGFDGRELIKAIQSNQIEALPQTFSYDKFPLKVIDVPINRDLQKGKNYRFMVTLPPNIKIALFHGTATITDWETRGKLRSINYTPKTEGKLSIGAFDANEKRYYIILSYKVK